MASARSRGRAAALATLALGVLVLTDGALAEAGAQECTPLDKGACKASPSCRWGGKRVRCAVAKNACDAVQGRGSRVKCNDVTSMQCQCSRKRGKCGTCTTVAPTPEEAASCTDIYRHFTVLNALRPEVSGQSLVGEPARSTGCAVASVGEFGPFPTGSTAQGGMDPYGNSCLSTCTGMKSCVLRKKAIDAQSCPSHINPGEKLSDSCRSFSEEDIVWKIDKGTQSNPAFSLSKDVQKTNCEPVLAKTICAAQIQYINNIRAFSGNCPGDWCPPVPDPPCCVVTQLHPLPFPVCVKPGTTIDRGMWGKLVAPTEEECKATAGINFDWAWETCTNCKKNTIDELMGGPESPAGWCATTANPTPAGDDCPQEFEGSVSHCPSPIAPPGMMGGSVAQTVGSLAWCEE